MVPTVWYWHTLGLHRNLDHKVRACCWPIRVTFLQLGGLAMHPTIHFDPQPLVKVIQTVRNTLPEGPCFLTQCNRPESDGAALLVPVSLKTPSRSLL